MKRIMAGFLMITSLSIALAQYSEPQTVIVNGRHQVQSATTVDAAKKLSKNNLVVLKGKVSKENDPNSYIFSDDTGNVFIDIDVKKLSALNVGPNDLVEVKGKIDSDWGMLEIDVYDIVKVQ